MVKGLEMMSMSKDKGVTSGLRYLRNELLHTQDQRV